MDREYYLGLDMGTSSIGWAVTDKEYNLLRAKGKDLWGVRLFSEAKTSAERRAFRTSRRRLQREKARIAILREFFSDSINELDPGFYQRLDDSKYFLEDKNEHQPFALFADSGFTDKDYYSLYPTVFHLRKELIENKEKHDVRLVYLALLNMFKHRGHFLNSNIDSNGVTDLNVLVEHLQDSLYHYAEIQLDKDLFSKCLNDILPSNNYSKSKKVEEIIKTNNINKTKDKTLNEIIKLICGLQGKLSVIFINDKFDEETKKISLSFRDNNFEDKLAQIESILTEESFDILLAIKQVHDWGILSNIMSGDGKTYQYLSQARVDSYNKHKKDLEILKRLYKTYAPKEYSSMFRKMRNQNYSAYVGSVNSGKEVIRRGGKGKRDELYSTIKKVLSTMPNSDEKQYVLLEIEKETFLPKQLTSSNGTIPNQVHKAELIAILKNAEEYLTFLKEKDNTGLTVSEKIIALFEFQIPYYIGPLVNNGQNNTWVVRKSKGKVLPWNFDEKIDSKLSAEKFINKMVKHCTYLNNETVLPKNSLLYEKFIVLNELNNLKLNGNKISIELKQAIFSDLFKTGKKVTQKKLRDYLISNCTFGPKDDIEISGIDGDFTNTLSNYSKFTNILNKDTLTFNESIMVENIIFWSTIYGESKAFLKERIETEYGNILSKDQIKRIIGLKFKEWGRFSKEFLETEGIDKQTGEINTIIDRMWNENHNLMELMSNKYNYIDVIAERGKNIEKHLTQFEYNDLDDLYISSPVKRMVWQTILIVKELYTTLGCEPKKIFVEMARDNDSKKERTVSRKKKFIELYKGCKDDGINWSNQLLDKEESDFRSKKLYLYYTQKGRCMYTGQIIELDQLLTENSKYDIDHIYPRHFVKDDSIENNLVLVKKDVNQYKSDTYPLSNEIRKSRHSMWKSLYEGGFITSEKYKRLIRNTEFSDEEQAAFINRQLVETRQGTKVLADLFKHSFTNAEIVYVKAANVSDFRHKFDLLKNRDINDFHHANDAYLNIVVGNTYNTKFTKDPMNFIKEYRKDMTNNKYHMYHMFDYDVICGNNVAWIAKNNQSISVIKEVMSKNTPLITMMNYEAHGGFADQTIYSADVAAKVNGVGYIPIKTSNEILRDTTKYGGFTKFTGAYFFLVEHFVKGKTVRTIEAMPLYLKDKLCTKEKIEQYCEQDLGYINPSVRLEKIKMYSLIKVDGYYMYLTGRTGKQLLVSNAVPLILNYNIVKYIRELSKISNENVQSKVIEDFREKNLDLYNILVEKHCEKIYAKRPNPIGGKLKDKLEKFKTLDLLEQVMILNEILKLTKLSNMGANLSLIGEASKAGIMTLNNNISGKTEFKLINKSITGLYENEVDLLSI